jgi:hypothetical protein
MSPANQTRSRVMLIAWDARRLNPAQPFADCLRGAWKFMKALAAYNPLRRARHSWSTPPFIRSPIARATGSQRFGGRSDYRAARLTARLGA